MAIYKDILGCPGYRIGDNGTVWSCRNNRWGLSDKWRRLTLRHVKGPGKTKYVRLSVVLGRGSRHYVHKLVLEAFVGPRPDGMEALHKDDDTTNNTLSNLRWGTRQENNCKLTPETVLLIKRDRSLGLTQQRIADRYGVSRPLISMVLSGKIWSTVQQSH